MKRLSPFFILAAGILWGSMGLFVRALNVADLATMNIVFLRAPVIALSVFAGMVLVIAGLVLCSNAPVK